MKKHHAIILKTVVILGVIFCLFWACTSNKTTFDIDGLKKLQQIDGFGVNANTVSLGSTDLIPAMDMLTDTLNAKIWRVVIETEKNWEVTNDNNDPLRFNWDFYNVLYETSKFQKTWQQIEYLNKKGITDNVIISVMGGIPEWMGHNIIKPEFEDEFVEMHTSFLYYAINSRHLKIGLYSPINETDLTNAQIEGPHSDPQQFARILHKMVERLNALGLDKIKLVSPDVANMKAGINQYMPLILRDTAIMSKVKYFGFHSYGGYYAPVDSFIKKSEYHQIHFWMTEFNAWRDGLDHGETGLYNYQYASECVKHLLDLLKNGTSACIVWEGYDSPYEHHGAMSYWGIMGLDEKTNTYYPRKHFYALAQVFKFVKEGSRQIGVNGADSSLTVLAFHDSESGRLSITGINTNKVDLKVKFNLANLNTINNMELYYTDSIKNLYRAQNISVIEQAIETTIPAKSIFTLTGITIQ
jgi:O-glycosyl hydrolase